MSDNAIGFINRQHIAGFELKYLRQAQGNVGEIGNQIQLRVLNSPAPVADT